MKEKLIVPFLFSNKVDKKVLVWQFCKYVDFCLKNDMPIIAEEEYCLDKQLIDSFEKGWNPQQWYNTAPSPTISTLQGKLKKTLISKEEKESYLKGLDIENSEESRKNLSLYDNSGFEKLIDKKLDETEKKYGEIYVIVVWFRYPALVRCAQRRNIKVLAQELSIVRGNGYYKEVLGSFIFDEKYTSEVVTREFGQISDSLLKELIFSRKEILALVLQKEHLDVLNRLYEPIYEFGVDADPDRDDFFEKYSTMSQEQICKKLECLSSTGNILARYHPNSKQKGKLNYDIDSSENSLEWILKCRRIVSGISNVGFEAMLLGRTAYVLCENIPYYLGNVHSLDRIEESTADVSVLNYLLFGYYTPWDLMFDCKYIEWRLSSPDALEIYRYHIAYLLNRIGLSYEEACDMTSLERYKYILKHKHDLSEEEIDVYVKRNKELSYSEMEEKYRNELKNMETIQRENRTQIEQISLELKKMRSSSSWKMTEPLRKIGVRLRKIRKHMG